jgi:hypothetical protein
MEYMEKSIYDLMQTGLKIGIYENLCKLLWEDIRSQTGKQI